MKRLVFIPVFLFILPFTLFSQPAQPKRNIDDIQKAIAASDARKMLIAVYDDKTKYSFVGTDRFIFARQFLGAPSYTMAAAPGAKFPLWELRIDTGFDTQYLMKEADNFVWKFNVYHHTFPDEAALKLKI